MKVFQIGFNKCGTSSIHERLERLGLKSIHHGDGKLARAIDENVKAGRPVLTGIEGYDAYTDLVHLTDTEHVEGFKYFREIERDVPDARFILNIRTKEKWLRSCRNHPRFLDR